MATPALRPLGTISRTRLKDLIIPVTAALAALYLTLRYGAFPEPGDVPVLDLIALEGRFAYAVPRVGYCAAPAVATRSLGCLASATPGFSSARPAGRAPVS